VSIGPIVMYEVSLESGDRDLSNGSADLWLRNVDLLLSLNQCDIRCFRDLSKCKDSRPQDYRF